jgi:hypothetical protein
MPTTNGAAYPQISSLSAFGKIAEKSEKVQKNNFSIKLRLTFYNDNWLHLKTAQRQNRFVSFFFLHSIPLNFFGPLSFQNFLKIFSKFYRRKIIFPHPPF